MEPIKTDWFPGGVKPARPGVYERLYKGDVPHPTLFHKWDGHQWMAGQLTAEAADGVDVGSVFPFPELRWRGVVPEWEGLTVAPATGDDEHRCDGCQFENRITHCRLVRTFTAVDCPAERIIWRPRSEVSNG